MFCSVWYNSLANSANCTHRCKPLLLVYWRLRQFQPPRNRPYVVFILHWPADNGIRGLFDRSTLFRALYIGAWREAIAVAMRYHMSSKFVHKSPRMSLNDLMILPEGLNCRRTRETCNGCLCEPPPPDITLPQRMSQSQQSLLVTFQVTISYEVYTRVFNTVKPSDKQNILPRWQRGCVPPDLVRGISWKHALWHAYCFLNVLSRKLVSAAVYGIVGS